MVKLEAENIISAGLDNGDSSLCDVEGVAWCFRFRNSSMKVGAATQVKVKI
jgi:hypothetical protein